MHYHLLYKHLKYQFVNVDLLQLALTHRSACSKNNERLEFLGDAILGYVIADALYQAYPYVAEGHLSRYRASLVKQATLAEIAREFQLGEYLRLGTGELKSGGFNRSSILADAVEAIIGAIFLDAEMDTVQQCILSWYGERINKVDCVHLKDPKTRLQEFLQSRRLSLPKYQVLKIDGVDHQQIFTVQCYIEGIDKNLQAQGKSRRKAEQEVAEKAIQLLGV